jgi:hypothetical protein
LEKVRQRKKSQQGRRFDREFGDVVFGEHPLPTAV